SSPPTYATVEYTTATTMKNVEYGNLLLSGGGSYSVSGSTITADGNVTLAGGASCNLNTSTALVFSGSTNQTYDAGLANVTISTMTLAKSAPTNSVTLIGGAVSTRIVNGDVLVATGTLNVASNYTFAANTTIGTTGGVYTATLQITA